MAPTTTTRRKTRRQTSGPTDDRALLLRIIEEAYDQPTWNATNLRGSIRRVSAEVAGWKPRGAKRTIADMVVHCAYWKYALRRRMRDDKRGSFAFKGSNWFRLPSPVSAAQWTSYRKLLDEEHRKLCDAIAEADTDLLYDDGGGTEHVRTIFGVAMHDAYHNGQINLLKALHKRSKAGFDAVD